MGDRLGEAAQQDAEAVVAGALDAIDVIDRRARRGRSS